MTHKVIEIDGIKYNLVPVESSEPITLRSRLEEMFDYNEVQVIFDEIKKVMPEEINDNPNSEWDAAWNCGYNFYRKQILNIMK